MAAPAIILETFVVGEVAYLRSGGCALTVALIDGGNVHCTWIYNGLRITDCFQAVLLTHTAPKL
jgi:uncharacterized protein YodC (DUF2158 family)